MAVWASVAAPDRTSGPGVQHEAFFYAADEDFLAGTVPFVLAGLGADEDVLVAMRSERISLLRTAIGDVSADRVHFADMRDIGGNPSRIIPAWQDFLDRGASSGRVVRGIGEPIWAQRSAAELVECQFHEALLNLAFDDGPGWRLMCPYDVSELHDDVVAEAFRSHPTLVAENVRRHSQSYLGDPAGGFLERPLPPPRGLAEQIEFGPADLVRVHEVVGRHARRLGLTGERFDDALLASHEIATNSLRHGGGRGTIRVWAEDGSLVCEVTDTGLIVDPLVGRRRPSVERTGGRGVWLANQLCDLVQIRSGADGTVVRLYLHASAPG